MVDEVEERTVVKFNPPVSVQRYKAACDVLAEDTSIRSVVDFGCASGHFLKYLKKLESLTSIALVDISYGCLDEAWYLARPLVWECLNRRTHSLSIKLYRGSVAEKDGRLRNFDAVTCIELVEHLPEQELLLLPETIFGFVCPKVAVITTPNKDFNVVFPELRGMRHWDHKFEWTREEFRKWCCDITERYPDYTVCYSGVGEVADGQFAGVGHCSQIATFRRLGSSKYSESPVDSVGHVYDFVTECIHPGKDG